jgi:hypothetical protein
MDSDMRRTGAPSALWAFLRSGDTAVGILVTMAVLFVVGSIVREVDPSAYDGLAGDDIRYFMDVGFRPRDLWFWGLLGGGVLLGLSLAVCSIEGIRSRVRRRARDPRDYGVVFVHVGTGIALLAHAIGGWTGVTEYVRATTGAPVALGRYEIRLLAVNIEYYPDGTLRRERARFEVRDDSGKTAVYHASPNSPARWAGGCEEILLMQAGADGIRSAAILAYRHAPGTIWLLTGGLVSGCGAILAGARRYRRQRSETEWAGGSSSP